MQIIELLAKDKIVEMLACNICKQGLTADVKDLCQMVYLILLEYPEDKIVDLYETKCIRFFLARILVNQFRSSNSPYHRDFRKFRERSNDITEYDFIDASTELNR